MKRQNFQDFINSEGDMMVNYGYDIQGLPKPEKPVVLELASVMWLIPGFRIFVTASAAILIFMLGFLTGAGCEATRQRMEYSYAPPVQYEYQASKMSR
jgi:hypothetical protein